jgi:hypothetical protein
MRRYRWKYTVLLLSAVVLVNVAVATPAPADQYINSSEPAFLRDIGPQDQRADIPLAAAVTAMAVGAVFYRGFRRYRPDTKDGGE